MSGITAFIHQGYLRGEELPNEYENLYDQMQLMTDFYLVSNHGIGSVEMIRENYLQMHSYLIYPCLIELGKNKLEKKY